MNPLVTSGFISQRVSNVELWYFLCSYLEQAVNARQNGSDLPDSIFKCIFLNENIQILIEISLKFVPKEPNNNIPALVQIMAWRRPGNKPLSEPVIIRLLPRICITRPQWGKEETVESMTAKSLIPLHCRDQGISSLLSHVSHRSQQLTYIYDEYYVVLHIHIFTMKLFLLFFSQIIEYKRYLLPMYSTICCIH